ncbi:DUF1800 domain-containing protein [Acetobacteraceae bacterium KSS8]|uniref:DUF1800 domain-containing protein n=1 Tax=Endosaccharibacter trunci TaxID=2812733 RepID=A0ABT1W1Z2_9PROT|nr:DUF1800 domain-containing protein [Acetobacteraceae bacterium KSS8]
MAFDALHAATRFGFGPTGDGALPADPRSWLIAQLGPGDPARFPTTLPSVSDGLILLEEQHKLKPPPGESLVAPLYRADASAQLNALVSTTAPFRERLVWFWANHFTVSTRRGDIRPIAGAFVREAIRPYVTGRFGDMLLAVMRHPAMLLYLDNASSVGPDSPAGQGGKHGLNENLARESLELHTVSPAAGYSQADVTAYASILTGWSVDRKSADPGFVFRDRAHQPGDKRVMGRVFPAGEAGGILMLDMLATHPATYRHLATKLALHFVSDTPSPDTIAHLTEALATTGGDLRAVSLALISTPEAWVPRSKLRTPFDLVIAAARLVGFGDDPDPSRHGRLAGMMAALGQPVWTAPLPNGWSDRAADWCAPEAMIARIDWSYRVAARPPEAEPTQLARIALGPDRGQRTIDAMRGAGDRRDALTLLLSSPGFQRR